MRTKDILLKGFEEIKTLDQYLYMDINNSITVNNGVTDLRIRMDNSCNYWCKNMNYPDLPEMNYNEEMNISTKLSIISLLKDYPAEDNLFKNKSRWEEIKLLTKSNVVLNHFYMKDR